MVRCTARLSINAFAIIALIGFPALALAQGAPEALPTIPTIGSSDLPRDLSRGGTFLSAEPLVKGVLLGLAFASVVTWTIWLAKTIELMAASARARRACAKLASARHLTEAVQALARAGGAGREFVDAAVIELQLSEDGMEREGVKGARLAAAAHRGQSRPHRCAAPCAGDDRRDSAIRRAVRHRLGHHEQLHRHLEVADHQSRRGGARHCGSVLATAIGLVAAIPAVVIYNVFSRQIASYRAPPTDASAEVLRLVGATSTAPPRRPAGRRGGTLSAAE